MYGGKSFFNGSILDKTELPFAPEDLLGKDFVYQKTICIDERPLHAENILELLDSSCMALYGIRASTDPAQLSGIVGRLIRENRCPVSGTEVIIHVLGPNADNPPGLLITCSRQLLYPSYTFWHSGLKALARPYEYPFPQHQTGISLSAHNYSAGFARRNGYEVTVTENYNGCLISAGEWPLFAMQGNNIFTASLPEGAAESVQRRAGLAAVQAAGYNLYETQLTREIISGCDELFLVNTQGVVSILSFDDRYYPNSGARKVAEVLSGAEIIKLVP